MEMHSGELMINKIKIAVACLFYFAVFFPLQAQDWQTMDADQIFSLARKEIFEGAHPNGREKLSYILGKNPAYDEVRVFLARTFLWDGLYSEARNELQTVLKRNRTDRDALDALIDVELSSEHFNDALEAAGQGLITFPNEERFLYKKAYALNSLGRDKEALVCLEKLLQINPAHKKGIELYNDVNLRNLRYSAGVTYGMDHFNRLFGLAHYVSAQLSRRNSWGSSGLSFNYAERFQTKGSQFELDLYPKIANGIYGHLNYAYSRSLLFPHHRIGTELFFNLPKSLEVSGGMRYMNFDRDTRIVIYTASMGWYFRNYWVSVRPYITPHTGSGLSASATFSFRKYFKDAENYLGLNGVLGFSPDLSRIQNGAGLSENEIYLLRSQGIGLSFQQTVHKTWAINLSVDLVRQALAFDHSRYVVITSPLVRVRKKL